MECKHLLDLPYYVLLDLATYLDAPTKFNLSRTCTYLKKIMMSPQAWRHIRFNNLTSTEQIKLVIERTTCDVNVTRQLILCGKTRLEQVIPRDFFRTINYLKNLTVLALDHLHIEGAMLDRRGRFQNININLFPEGLEELSLRGSTIFQSFDFFRCHKDRTQMRVVLLDECHWLNQKTIKPLSTSYPNLEILSLARTFLRETLEPVCFFLDATKLQQMTKLKILDLRLARTTYILNWHCCQVCIKTAKCPNLQAVYMESRIFENGERREYETLKLVAKLMVKDPKAPRPKSVLYEDPYNSLCTCGYEELHHSRERLRIPKRKLSIRNFKEVNWEELENLNLDLLDVSEAEVKMREIRQFAGTHPNCRIVHPQYCICHL